MTDSTADDGSQEPDDASQEPGDAELGAAVDDAMGAEMKRQFVARILGLDRGEGVGRRGERWEDPPEADPGPERPDDPAD